MGPTLVFSGSNKYIGFVKAKFSQISSVDKLISTIKLFQNLILNTEWGQGLWAYLGGVHYGTGQTNGQTLWSTRMGGWENLILWSGAHYGGHKSPPKWW